MGQYDLPAAIEKVQEISHSQKIHYIGSSQGTSMLLVALAEKPEYWAERLYSCTLLAPVALLNHVSRG